LRLEQGTADISKRKLRSYMPLTVNVLDTHNAKGRGLDFLAVDSSPGVHCFDAWLKEFLGEKRRDECAQDHRADQERVLRPVDDVVLQSKQCRNRSKG